MKKILLKTLLVSTLITASNAEIYTGTSLTAGIGNYGKHMRIDQYIGDTDTPSLYAKIGISQESLDYSELYDTYEGYADGVGMWDGNEITSLVVGVGYNAYEYKGFFLDISGDYYYALSYDDRAGSSITHSLPSNGWIVTDNLVKEEGFNSLAAEIGMGYSVGSWSFRADFIYIMSQPELTSYKSYVDEADPNGTAVDEPTKHELDNRIYTGLGITYWW